MRGRTATLLTGTAAVILAAGWFAWPAGTGGAADGAVASRQADLASATSVDDAAPAAPARVDARASGEAPRDAAPGPALDDPLVDASDRVDDDLRWERRYRGMSTEQLERELERLQLLYTDEMSRITWPMLQGDECQWADTSKGESVPPSRIGALTAQGRSSGSRQSYVVVTEEQAPRVHEWMREMVWLMDEVERRGEAGGGD